MLNSCNFEDKSDENPGEKDIPMSEFVDDLEFREAHNIPVELSAELMGKMINIPIKGGEDAQVYAPVPPQEGKPYLFVIHEWWGLNKNIKMEADRYYKALDSINVLALDLYDGEVGETQEEAAQLSKTDRTDRISAIFDALFDYVGNERVGTVGWCYGGGYSLRAAIHGGNQVDACVIFYGSPVKTADQLQPLKAPVLGIWAEQDKHLTPEVVDTFKQLMKENGKSYQQEMYDADHAFANPSSDAYSDDAAVKATAQSIAFLREHLL